jgi:ARG/rhodanese/phosphatase superfamily protein
MKAHAFVLTLGVVLLAMVVPLGMLIKAQDKELGREPRVAVSNYRLSGPYTHKNLTIFLIHGKSVVVTKKFITLQEALVQKKIVVYETKTVNELAIENLSNEDVYVQSGDIVKGGQQDRMMAVDLIVPPKSGRMPIAAFCVEHGRWSKRSSERAEVFSSSSEVASTKDLKLAAKSSRSQGEVWQNVTVAQDKLSQNVMETVNVTASPSSLQLALENKKLNQTADSYIRALSGITSGKSDVIGYVFAINGKINSADVYGSGELFKKLWPKLLKANAIEAIAELQKDNFKPASAEQAKAFLTEAESGRASEKDVTGRVKLVTREDDKNIFFETRDDAQQGAWVHRNYIKKE